MKNPSARYLAGYLFRTILGTALVLCAISAARIMLVSPDTMRDNPPWDKALVLPDRLVELALSKREAARPAQGHPETDTPVLQPEHDAPKLAPSPRDERRRSRKRRPRPADTDGAVPPDMDSKTATHQAVPAMPQMPSMPEMPSIGEGSNTRPAVPDPVPEPPPPDAAEWAITKSPETPIYDANGKRTGHVPAGTFLKISGRRSSSAGELLVCKLMLSRQNQPEAIIRARDTLIHQGDLSRTTSRERKLNIQHARVLAEITAREDEIRADAEGRNPQAAQYAKALNEYKQFAKKAKATREAYNSASGPRRMELADALRALKHDETRIVEAYKSAKRQNEEWKQNRPTPKVPDFNRDQELARLRQRAETIEQEIARL